jgi:hypothetical protein
MQLSIRRAEAVTTVIQSKLRKDLPSSVDIVIVGNTPVTPSPSRIPIRQQGKGSKSPIIVEGPSDNKQLNRSVMASLSYDTARTATRVKIEPNKVPLHPTHWGLQVLRFDAAAVVVGAGKIRFRLESFGRTRRYEATLTGWGLDNPLGDPGDKSQLSTDSGGDDNDADWVYFTTKPVGFDDFVNNEIIVWKAGSGVGIPKTKLSIGVSDTLLRFDRLGGDSDSILIDFDYGFGKGPSGFRLKGVTKAIDKNPGDSIDGYIYSDQTKRFPGVQKTDSRIVTFATGEWKLTEDRRLYLEKWASDWADKIRVINQI